MCEGHKCRECGRRYWYEGDLGCLAGKSPDLKCPECLPRVITYGWRPERFADWVARIKKEDMADNQLREANNPTK